MSTTILEKNPTHTIREHRHCKGTELYAYERVEDRFESVWQVKILEEVVPKKADQKAIDFAVFYFAIPRGQRNIKHAAMCYGIERETAANYMLRLEKLGYLKAMESPILARDVTLPRVYSRRIFWTEDFWNAF